MNIYDSNLFSDRKEADEFLEALYIINKVAKKYRNTGKAYFEERFCYKIKKDAIRMFISAGIMPDGYHSYKLPGQKHKNYRLCWVLNDYPYHDEQISAVKNGKNKSEAVIREEFEKIYHISLPTIKYMGEIKDLVGSDIDKRRKLPGNGKGNNIEDTEKYFKVLINKLYQDSVRDDMLIKLSKLRDIKDIADNSSARDTLLNDVEYQLLTKAD